MKEIYFACSIRGGRSDANTYAKLVNYIKLKANVLSEIFADGNLTSEGMDKPSNDIWKNDTTWIRKSNGIIAEVTNPSLGVGYEIALAESLNIPVLALFRNDSESKLSAMIDGSPGVIVCYYLDMSTAFKAIDKFLDSLQ